MISNAGIVHVRFPFSKKFENSEILDPINDSQFYNWYPLKYIFHRIHMYIIIIINVFALVTTRNIYIPICRLYRQCELTINFTMLQM